MGVRPDSVAKKQRGVRVAAGFLGTCFWAGCRAVSRGSRRVARASPLHGVSETTRSFWSKYTEPEPGTDGTIVRIAMPFGA